MRFCQVAIVALVVSSHAAARDPAKFEAYQQRLEARRVAALHQRAAINARKGPAVFGPRVLNVDPARPMGSVGWDAVADRWEYLNRRGVPSYGWGHHHHHCPPVRGVITSTGSVSSNSWTNNR